MLVNLQSLIIVIRACNYELNTVMEQTHNHRRVPLFITFSYCPYFRLTHLSPRFSVTLKQFAVS